MDKIKNFYINLSSKKKEKVLLITQVIAWLIWTGLSWKEFSKYNRIFDYDLFFYSSMLLSLPLIIKLLKFNILETPNLNKSVKRICILFFLIGILNIVFSLAFGYYQRSQIELVDSNFELNELKESLEKKCKGKSNLFDDFDKIYDSIRGQNQKCISELIGTHQCEKLFRDEREKEIEKKTNEGMKYDDAEFFANLGFPGTNFKNCNFSFLHKKLSLPDYKKIEDARMDIGRKFDKENLEKGFLVTVISIGAGILYIIIPVFIKKFKMWFNKE